MTKTPGIWQMISLQQDINSKKNELTELENQISLLEEEQVKLTSDSRYQENEIRRVLGYAAPNELIFEF